MKKLIVLTAATLLSTGVMANELNGSLNTNNNNYNHIDQGQATTIDTNSHNTTHNIGGTGNTTTNVNNTSHRPQGYVSSTNLTTSGQDTCFGSSTGSLSVPGLGVTSGKTVIDDNCVRLKNAKLLSALGLTDAAVALLAQDSDVARAITIAYPDLARKLVPTNVTGTPAVNTGDGNIGRLTLDGSGNVYIQ